MARIAAVTNRLRQKLGSEPSLAVVAEELGVSETQVVELARIAEGVLDIDELTKDREDLHDEPAERNGLAAEEAEDDLGEAPVGPYSRGEVHALLKAYAAARARLLGSRREGEDARPAAHAGTLMHMRLLDLERALERLPEAQFAATDLVELQDFSAADAGRKLGVSERTVYNRLKQALGWVVDYLNDSPDLPALRTLTYALDPNPLLAVTECVRRHRATFEQIAEHAANDPKLAGLQVRWLPATGGCVPTLHSVTADGSEETAWPLNEILGRVESRPRASRT